MENKIKARCQLLKKAMKTKQTNKHGQKKKKKEKEQKCKVTQRQIKKIYMCYRLTTTEKNKQPNIPQKAFFFCQKNKQNDKCREKNNNCKCRKF